MKKKSIVQTGTSIYLKERGLIILAHKEPSDNEINVFVVTYEEYSKQPNPYKANILKKYSFSSDDVTIDDVTIDDALDEVVSIYCS